MTQEKAVEVWWWTMRPANSRCDNCCEPIPARTAFAYKHATREGYCSICVDATGLAPRTSRRLARQAAPAVAKASLTGKSQKAARRDAVVEALRLGPATTWDVAARTGLSVMLAGAALGRLQATGNVVREAGGSRPWRLTTSTPADTSKRARKGERDNSEKSALPLAV